MVKTLARSIREFKKPAILTPFLVTVEVILECIIPLIIANLVNQMQAGCSMDVIVNYGIQLLVLAVLSLIFGVAAGNTCATASTGFARNLRRDMFYCIQDYSFENIDKFSVSSLVTRMTTDVTVLQNAINGGLRPLVRSPVMLVMGLGLSFWMNARLSLVFFVCIPILAVALFFIMRKVAPMYARLQAAVDHVNGVVREGLVAIRAVKAFVRGEYEAEKFSRVNGELMDTSRRTFRYAVLNLPAFQLVMYTSTVLLLWFGGNMILRGQLQVGELTGFLSYVMQVMNSLMMLSNVFLLLTRSLASARRIREVEA